MADMTIEDAIIRRITIKGMKANSYNAFINFTGLSEDVVRKIHEGLKSTTVNASKGIGPADLKSLLLTLQKFNNTSFPGQNIPISKMLLESYSSIANQKYILDNKLGSAGVLKGYIDPVIDTEIGVKPISRLAQTDSDYALKIGGGGERVTPTSIPNDVYPTTRASVDMTPKGSLDRITARLIHLTGDRAPELQRLTLNSFDMADDPTYQNSGNGKKNLKQAVHKGRLSYFTDLEKYYIYRARQLAILNGAKSGDSLFPNFSKIDKANTKYLTDTYGGTDQIRQFNERLGVYQEGGSSRVFVRNLFKDRVGALFAADFLQKGDNFTIAINAINNQDLTHGIKLPVSMIKYMSADGAVRAIISPYMDVMDNQYTTYSGWNSVESMLAHDGVINEVSDANGKVLIEPTEVLDKHKGMIPGTHAILKNTYAMGWMPPEQLRSWNELHSVRSASSSVSSVLDDIHKLNAENNTFIDDAVSKSLYNTQKRMNEAAKLNADTRSEINETNKYLEEEKIIRQEEKRYQKEVLKEEHKLNQRSALRSSTIDDIDLEKESTNEAADKPVPHEGESPKAFKQRLKVWLRKGGIAGLGLLSTGIRLGWDKDEDYEMGQLGRFGAAAADLLLAGTPLHVGQFGGGTKAEQEYRQETIDAAENKAAANIMFNYEYRVGKQMQDIFVKETGKNPYDVRPVKGYMEGDDTPEQKLDIDVELPLLNNN